MSGPSRRMIAAAVALHVAITLQAVNPWHPDEHFQILEFAWARAGLAPTDALPWEWAARIRSTLQPALALVVLRALRAIGITSPWAWVLTLRLGTLLLVFVTLASVLRHVARAVAPSGRTMLWLSALFLWFLPLFLSRFTSENWGGLALAAAIPLAEREEDRRDGLLGALLGLSFVFRFQMAFAILPLIGWIALRTSGGARRTAPIVLAAGAVVAIGVVVDRWFYGAWVLTPWRYLHANLIEGVAATFGTSPWWTYLAWLPLWAAPPLGLAVVALLGIGMLARPTSPWSWTFAAFLLGHSLVAHKELRFLFPVLYAMPVLMAFGWEAVAARVGASPQQRAWRAAGAVLLAQNAFLLVVLTTPAIHRGKEMDAHYLRFLWREAEAHPDATLYVLTPDADPWQAGDDLDIHVFRHPRVRGVTYTPGTALAALVPTGTPREDVLVLTREAQPPRFPDAATGALAYRAEPGYREMARWIGAEDGALERWLETVDRWDDATWVRRVWRVDG